MTSDEVFAAVVASLDQFISRGAAPDILDLRARLVHDSQTRRLFEVQLPSREPSVREAFDAMTAFFKAEFELGGSVQFDDGPPDLFTLIDWMSWIPSDSHDPAVQSTSDPAQWHDWLAAVDRDSRSA